MKQQLKSLPQPDAAFMDEAATPARGVRVVKAASPV